MSLELSERVAGTLFWRHGWTLFQLHLYELGQALAVIFSFLMYSKGVNVDEKGIDLYSVPGTV